MNEKWQQYAKRFVELSRRERVLIGSAIWIGLLLLGYTFVVEPALNQYLKVDKQLQQLTQDKRQLGQQLELLQLQLQQDPNQQLQQQLQQLNTEISASQLQLEQQLVDLVVPEQMAASLAMLLARAEGVSLIKLEIQDSEALTEQGGLFRHGVMLELEGSFFALQAALGRMEQMERRFYWRQLSYRVTKYPLARLQLQLDTLGTEQEPIRVGYHQNDGADTAGNTSGR
ncbi:hypothetical protein [uncultured Ferrimonas sp.]|uniref:hypothetical protein n=1 Tax=uncultured Ferrimonas sp. TaxID=432640 RepID=UPI00260D7863|nr:hypothetical protein [uncultured Ferrimonas sp.]